MARRVKEQIVMSPIFDENGNQLAENIEDLVKSQGLRDQVKELPKLREQLAEKDKAIEQRDRQLAGYEVGLPPTRLAAMWLKGYDGPLDAESIRKAATEDGLIQTSGENANEENFDHETQRLQRGTGATSPGEMPDELAEYNRLIASAKNQREIIAIYESDLGQRVQARARAS